MRKLAAGVLLAGLVMAAGVTSVSASEVAYGRHYADANKDGICDYCGQENGCNLEICNANGRYFVDKDGDGICDNYGSSSCHKNNRLKVRQGNGSGSCNRGKCRR